MLILFDCLIFYFISFLSILILFFIKLESKNSDESNNLLNYLYFLFLIKFYYRKFFCPVDSIICCLSKNY